jgi:predicted component of type VI protein secretion system
VAETLYQLTVRKGPKVGETFFLETISLTVGRDPVSDVILNDPEVSRQHARFSQIDTGYQVQDLGSTNGTFVNGQRLESDPVDLEPGFTISMGSGVTLLYDVVPTGDALDATIVDQSGMGEVAQQGSGMADEDEEWEAAVPDLPQFAEEPEVPVGWEPDPSPPFTPPPLSPRPAASQLVATPEKDEADRQKRRNTIIAVTAVILLLCCCGFLAFMWFRGGDLLLEALGLL